MKRKIIIIFGFLLNLMSCSHSRYEIVSVISEDFKKDSSSFGFLREYILTNNDQVTSVYLSDNKKISFKTLISEKESILPVSEDNSISFKKYITDTSNFYKVVTIMKSKDMISINKRDYDVKIGYNKILPCIELNYSNSTINHLPWLQDELKNYKNTKENEWAYKLNGNWYIRRVACFD